MKLQFEKVAKTEQVEIDVDFPIFHFEDLSGYSGHEIDDKQYIKTDVKDDIFTECIVSIKKKGKECFEVSVEVSQSSCPRDFGNIDYFSEKVGLPRAKKAEIEFKNALSSAISFMALGNKVWQK